MRLLASSSRRNPSVSGFFFAFLFTLIVPRSSTAQTQQPFLFANEGSNGQITGIAVFVRNDQTGELTEAANSPFTSIHSPHCGLTVIDPKGRFGYGACGLGASMYTINATTGAVAEVPGSPFAASEETTPGDVVAESTGQYVYVLKADWSAVYPQTSTVVLDSFQVDPGGLQLIAPSSQQIPLDGTLVAVNTSQHGFYLLLNQNQNTGSPVAALYAILFDPITGQASAPQPVLETGNDARGMLLDNLGKNLVISVGQNCGSLWFLQLSQADGTLSTSNSAQLACDEFPTPLAIDPTGSYFYGQFPVTGQTQTVIRIFDISSAAESASSPLPASLDPAIGGQADPQGPFNYIAASAPAAGISVFGVDSTTGYPQSPSSFSNPLFPGRSFEIGPATIDVNTQPVQAPAVGLSANSLDFGSVTTGQTSLSQTVILTDTGALALSLTSIQLTGSNAADFTETDTCMSSPQLQPDKSCTITVSYHPSVAGSSSAAILIADNASGSPQQIALTGTGTNPGPPPGPAPAVTLNPSPLNFPGTVTESTTSAPQNVVLTNSGNATLHVQTVVVGGVNGGDFAMASNNCVGQLAANTSCVVALTFSPTGVGVRSATVAFTDDASNSPQILNVFGTGGLAASITATGSTALSISAGQSAQFNLQATPGPGFSGTLSFTCTGVPFVSTCSAPSSISVANGVPAPFVVTVTTTAASSTPFLPSAPLSPPMRLAPPLQAIWITLACAILLFLLVQRRGLAPNVSLRSSLTAALSLALAVTLSTEIGCGGGSSSGTTPQQPSSSVQTTATPALQPPGGVISTGFPSVVITDATPGAAIYYTTDGSTPTTSSPVYSGAFIIQVPATVQALATASGYGPSALASASYKFQTPSGTSTILLTATAVPTGSSKPLQLSPLQLSLTVK